MEISYRNTFEDSFRFNLFHFTRNPLSLLLSTAMSMLFFPWSSFHPFDSASWAITNIILIILWVSLFYLLYATVVSCLMLVILYFNKNKTFLTDHEVILTDDCLTEKTEFGTSTYNWNAIHRIKQTKRYIFIYVSPAAAHVVPTKSFKNAESLETFYHFIQSRMSKDR